MKSPAVAGLRKYQKLALISCSDSRPVATLGSLFDDIIWYRAHCINFQQSLNYYPEFQTLLKNNF